MGFTDAGFSQNKDRMRIVNETKFFKVFKEFDRQIGLKVPVKIIKRHVFREVSVVDTSF